MEDTPSPTARSTSKTTDGSTHHQIEARRTLGIVDPSFYIIGVGASAGGLDAIKQLVAQAGHDFQHSFAVIQHISPDHKSLMAEILARETVLPVLEVSDDMPVEPGKIYLIPPMSNVVIQGTHDDTQPRIGIDTPPPGAGLRFSLVAPPPRPQLNLPIDLFFHSLSEAVGDRAIAIVLSGTGTDGSRGLRAVKDREGFVIVQEPDTADFDGMPIAAIATKIVDLITPPDAMIAEIHRYIALREDGVQNVEAMFRDYGDDLEKLLRDVGDSAGIDFSQYKKPTLKRRIARRMGLHRCDTLKHYLDFISKNPNEISVLHREFLVGVTNFFRDIPAWNALQELLPRIFDHGDTANPVKVWSLGCSTGEEAYSAAMLLEIYRRENGIEREFRVFASDANEEAIKSAKDGIYPVSVVEEIPSRYRIPEFLTYLGDTFRITSTIRNKVIFNKHNVLEDPPYINTDLVICRNLLIYLAPDMQKKVLSLFSFSMRREGVLFLGAAESVSEPFSQFQTEVQQARIYSNARTRVRGKTPPLIGRPQFFPLPRTRRLATRAGRSATMGVDGILRLVLSDVGASLVIIDDGGTVLDTYGDYHQFMRLPEEAFSANLFDLVNDRLKSAISLLMRRAEKEGSATSVGTKCPVEDGIEVVDIFCNRLDFDTHPNAFAILIRQSDKLTSGIDLLAGASDVSASSGDADVTMIAKLESEIEGLQEMLSVTTEDLSVSNEELQTANEELTVSNEELQASNEEMQSINEELHTVNAENSEKILELEAAGADIENLLNTAELAVVFLDDSLAIRRFNETFTRYVDLKPEDYGRPLSSFTSAFTHNAHATFHEMIAGVHRSGEDASVDLALSDGSAATASVRPFRAAEGEAVGVAVSVLDTTRSKRLEEEVKMQRDRIEGILETEAAGYWDWDIPANTEFLSPSFKAMFGYADHEMENTPMAWQQIMHAEDLPGVLENFEAHVASGGEVPYRSEVRYHHKNGSIVWVLCSGRVVEWGEDGAAKRMIGAHFDITSLKLREESVYREADEIRRFSFIAAHDLLQPVNTLDRSLAALLEDVSDSLDSDQKTLLDFLHTATDRMRKRIKGVLDYARFFDETIVLEETNLSVVVHQCLEDLGSQIDEIDADIFVGDLPSALVKPDLILHVFQNLLSNSMKYRKQGVPCRIRVEAATADSGFVAVRVSDNGIGIAAEHREKVFKLFSRLHTESEYEGVGVGLALSDKLMKLHGGRIGIEDGIEGGTAFLCYFKAPPGDDDV